MASMPRETTEYPSCGLTSSSASIRRGSSSTTRSSAGGAWKLSFRPCLMTYSELRTTNKKHATFQNSQNSISMQRLPAAKQLKKELADDEDPRGPLLELAEKISSQLGILRRLLKAQTKGARGGPKRHKGPSPEEVATEATRERQQEGYTGESDKDEKLPADERKGIIEETLVDTGLTTNTAKELAAKTISDGLKYVFAEADLETSAFFSVKPRGGAVIITLNTSHPAYKKPCRSAGAGSWERRPRSAQTAPCECARRVKTPVDGLGALRR